MPNEPVRQGAMPWLPLKLAPMVLCLYLMGLNLSNERGSVRLLWREKRLGV